MIIGRFAETNTDDSKKPKTKRNITRQIRQNKQTQVPSRDPDCISATYRHRSAISDGGQILLTLPGPPHRPLPFLPPLTLPHSIGKRGRRAFVNWVTPFCWERFSCRTTFCVLVNKHFAKLPSLSEYLFSLPAGHLSVPVRGKELRAPTIR